MLGSEPLKSEQEMIRKLSNCGCIVVCIISDIITSDMRWNVDIHGNLRLGCNSQQIPWFFAFRIGMILVNCHAKLQWTFEEDANIQISNVRKIQYVLWYSYFKFSLSCMCWQWVLNQFWYLSHISQYCQARFLLISAQISIFHSVSLNSETKGAELTLKSQKIFSISHFKFSKFQNSWQLQILSKIPLTELYSKAALTREFVSNHWWYS